MIEIWKNIVGYEGLYEVSNWGRVKSLNYNHTGQEMILKNKKHKGGYLRVGLCKEGKVKYFSVHRLVAQAFIPNPDNLPQVNHKDEVKTNNFVFVREDGSVDFNKSNLEWMTAKENMNYGTARERTVKARRGVYNTKCSKPVAQKTKDGELVKIWPSVAEVQRQTGWSAGSIAACCRGIRKSLYGYRWSYTKDFLLFKSDSSNLTSLPN